MPVCVKTHNACWCLKIKKRVKCSSKWTKNDNNDVVIKFVNCPYPSRQMTVQSRRRCATTLRRCDRSWVILFEMFCCRQNLGDFTMAPFVDVFDHVTTVQPISCYIRTIRPRMALVNKLRGPWNVWWRNKPTATVAVPHCPTCAFTVIFL